jgi:hypothetical protein
LPFEPDSLSGRNRRLLERKSPNVPKAAKKTKKEGESKTLVTMAPGASLLREEGGGGEPGVRPANHRPEVVAERSGCKMTEDEWQNCQNPMPMLEFLGSSARASDRKLRLFVCACCRRIPSLISDGRCRRAVEMSERFADGLSSEQELEVVRLGVEEAETRARAESKHDEANAAHAAWRACFPKLYPAWTPSAIWLANEQRAQPALLRDLFPHPVRLNTIQPSWLEWNEGTVVNLARSIYDEFSFQDLPILADALEEAGCCDADILNHCRRGGTHIRGCWVIDLVLGRS